MRVTDLSAAPPAARHTSPLWDPALVFVFVLLACLVGIATRPAGLLAAVWPANALLLGLFVRYPKLATPTGWLAALAAYFAADLATDGTLLGTSLLTAGNLVGVGAGVALYSRVDENDRRLRRPLAVVILVLVTAAAALTSGIAGAAINPLLFHGDALTGLAFWSVTEFVNYIALLPVVLTLPLPTGTPQGEWYSQGFRISWSGVTPIVATVGSCIFGLWIGGPGALAFPVPALLWCAITYDVPKTAVITFLISMWSLVAISTGAVDVGADFNSVHSLLSIRLGVALMALAPIAVASVTMARAEFQALLQRMVTNDPLTAALTRRAFAIRTRNLLAPPSDAPAAVLAFGIDHLKEINATLGHAAGDDVLKAFARTARALLPAPHDLGRLGGDEFAVLLPDASASDAAALGRRICEAFAAVEIGCAGKIVRATVSVGMATTQGRAISAETLLNRAEAALQQAKRAGGNCVALGSETQAHPTECRQSKDGARDGT